MNQVAKLKGFCKKIGSGITPRGGDSVYINSGVSLIRSQNVYNGTFTTQGLAFIDNNIAQKMKGVELEKEDILLNITGDSVARCCIVPDELLPARVNQHVSIIRTHKEKLDPQFLMYYLISPLMQARMLSFAGSGGTRKALTKDMIENFDIPVIDFRIQQNIASILSAYDDLINLNRRRIQLLEESARLLFREWFVYFRFPFDPAQGKPGHENVSIVDGVPEGWRKATTFDAMQVMSGGTPKTTSPTFWDGEIPFYTPKDSVVESYVINTEKHLTESGIKNCNSKLYPKDTVFMTARGTVGNLNLAQRPMAMNQSCYALSGRDGISQKFLLCAMREAIQIFKKFAVGAVFDAIIVDTFKLIPFIIPEKKILSMFEEAIDPIFSQIEKLLLQNQKLAQARDLLLPRLMSGEIEPKEIAV